MFWVNFETRTLRHYMRVREGFVSRVQDKTRGLQIFLLGCNGVLNDERKQWHPAVLIWALQFRLRPQHSEGSSASLSESSKLWIKANLASNSSKPSSSEGNSVSKWVTKNNENYMALKTVNKARPWNRTLDHSPVIPARCHAQIFSSLSFSFSFH